MNLKLSTLLITIILFAQQGCYRENAPAKYLAIYYKDMPADMRGRLEKWSGDTKVIRVEQFEDFVAGLSKDNFVPVAQSSFNWSDFPTDDEIKWAGRRARADIALYTSKYQQTVSGVRGVPNYTPGTTTNINTAGTVGGFGGVPYSQNSTVTTPGRVGVSYVPYQANVYSQTVLYWRKMQPRPFGANFQKTDEDWRKKHGRNFGVVCKFVINDSPAYKANLFSGDIVLRVNAVEIANEEQMMKVIEDNLGKSISLDIDREGKEMQIAVSLGNQVKLNNIDINGDTPDAKGE